jgi:hypothetical protein
MKCYVCQFEGHENEFGRINPYLGGGNEGSSFGSIYSHNDEPTTYPVSLGKIDVFVYPECGAIHTDMRGWIRNSDRKPHSD